MDIATSASTQAVFNHHLQALKSRDLDELMKDYADEAILLIPNKVIKGNAQVREFFSETLKLLPPEVTSAITIIHQEVEGEYMLIVWSAGEAIPRGVDSFCIRDGKIVMQSGA